MDRIAQGRIVGNHFRLELIKRGNCRDGIRGMGIGNR
jgi:hypothetical protein